MNLDTNSGGRRLSRQSSVPAPVISVVTATRNCAAELERTMLSVLGQRVEGLEYIIVDGGSSDGTLELLRKYEDKLEYWVSEPDGGIADAFNKGLSLAGGGVVGILNAGDTYEPGALAAVTAAASADPAAEVFYGRVRYCRPGGDDFTLEPDHTLLKGGMTLSHPACFVRLGAYRKYGFFDAGFKIAMDYELLLRFYLGGAVFRKLDLLAANMDMDGVSNIRWFSAYREGARAVRRHLGVPRAVMYFIGAVLKKSLSTALERVGLDALLDIVRTKRAALKRTKLGQR